MPQSTSHSPTLGQGQQALILEAQRRLGVRDRISPPKRASILSKRLPLSGNAALSATALIQALLGIEFILSGLNKLADPHYLNDFTAFVRSAPGAMTGLLASLIQWLVLPNIGIFARLIETSELLIGIVLLVGAADVARRRIAGPLGAQHGYEAPLAFAAALGALAAAALTLSIGVVMGEALPTITAGRAFSSAIPIELFIVPLGVAIAWLELGRFLALRRALWVDLSSHRQRATADL